MKPIEWLIRCDQKAVARYSEQIRQGRYRGWQKVCRWVGLPLPMGLAYAGIGGLAYLQDGWNLVTLVAVTIVLTNAVNLAFKALFRRVRPQRAVFESPLPYDQYAFPSGHAATTMSLAISLGSQNGRLLLGLLIWAVLMGISRFFGELHHPSDILGGFLIGAVTGYLIQWGYLLIG